MHNPKSYALVIRIIRAISQVLFFIVLPGLYISALSGIKQIVLSILNHSFQPATLLPQIVATIAIIPLTILLGRFFCGWMCAFGSMGDFIYEISSKIWKRKPRIPESVDRALKWVKYVWLVVLVALVWVSGATIFQSANPWDAFGMLLTIGKAPAFSIVFATLLPAFLLLVGIMVGSVFVHRFFCRYLCPLGAVFAILSKLRLTHIKKLRTSCGKCRICTNHCPMGISLYKMDEVKSGECIECMECVAVCPRKNTTLAVSGSSVRPVAAGVMAAAVMTGTYYAGTFSTSLLGNSTTVAAVDTSSASQASTSDSTSAATSSDSSSLAAASPSSSSTASSSSQTSSQYKDGTYEGSGTGFRGGTTTVSVTVKGGKVTSVTVKSTEDDQQFFDRAYSTVSAEIIKSQFTDVQAVSGATYSSNGIMQAVANALEKAK